MSCDCHEVTTRGHDVTQQGKMAVVHIRAIKGDHMMKLLLDSLPHGLDAKNSENLDNVVRRRSYRVHRRLTENLHQVHAICLEDPLLKCLVLSLLIDDDSLLGVLRWIVHVDLGDLLNALEGHVREEVGLQTAKESVILHLVQLLLVLKIRQ